MTRALSPIDADYRSTAESCGYGASPCPPQTAAEFRAFADDEFDKAADLALRFKDEIDGADALSLLNGTAKELDEVRERFVAWAAKRM